MNVNSLMRNIAGSVIFLIMGCSAIAETSGVLGKRNGSNPNIIFILADDLGYHQLGCYGSAFYETSHIDKIASEGIKFTNAYAAASVCSPTRSSILTGKYPANNNLTKNIPNYYATWEKLIDAPFAFMLPLAEVTIAEKLKKAGYATGHFGKWHLNVDKEYSLHRPGDPKSQGFDDVLTTHKANNGPESPFKNDWYHVRHITERTLDFIERNKDQPFFAYVSHNAIHRPEIEEKSLIEKYRKKPQADNAEKYGEYNPVQAAMLERLDREVGRIINKIEELGLEKNTLVIFYSDNGQLQSDKKAYDFFRGSKGDLYEGGIRVPLIVKWPGIVKEGVLSDELVISNDFFPTLCEVAGISEMPEKIDGISLMPIFRNPKATLERSTLFWHWPHHHHLSIEPQGAIRKGKYKLIENFQKTMLEESGGWELYDLDNDPQEKNNLIEEKPEIAFDLRQELVKWREQIGAQSMKINNKLN